MLRNVLPRPEADSSAIVDRIDHDHRVWIGKRYMTWRTGFLQCTEHCFIEMSLDFGRFEIKRRSASVQPDME